MSAPAVEANDLLRSSLAPRVGIARRGGETLPTRRRGWLVRRALLAADVVGLLTAFAAAEVAVGRDAGTVGAGAEALGFLVALPVWVVAAKLSGLYDSDEERTDHSTVDDVSRIFHVVTAGVWLFFALASLGTLARPSLPKLVVFWGVAILLVSLARAVARSFARRSVAYLQNAIVVGAGDVGQTVARKLLKHPEYGINVVGFVDSAPKPLASDLAHLALLGPTDALPHAVRLLDVERVVIAFSNDPHERELDIVRTLKDFDVQVDIVPRLFEVFGARVGIHTVEGLPLVGLPPVRLSASSQLLKRCLDVVAASLALVALLPLLAVVAALVKLDSRGPVLFRQTRMGSRNRRFRIFKFRTMVVGADALKAELAHLNRHAHETGDARMFKIVDDPRITRVGRFLRASMIDELPQLLNVLRGEMSLVGPRPLILEEDCHVDGWARRRLDLKPGMTGLWQVLGRSSISFDEMVRLDYLYVTNWSLANDCRLILRTIPLVLRRQGEPG